MLAPSEDESTYRFLTDAAVKAMREAGWSVSKAPGQGRSNTWNITKKGKSGSVSIRTTRNRWIAYQPQNNGKKWKTLDDVDFVCISAFSYNNVSDEPVGVSVHLLDASVVQDVFRRNYTARTNEDHNVTNDFGMWICMDECEGTHAAHVGSGFATAKNLIANYVLEQADDIDISEEEITSPARRAPGSMSVSDILDSARAEISKITGIPVEGITLDLHLKA